jgi:hypothetical protein
MKLWLALAVVLILLALLLVPPFVSISSYKSRITQLMSVSLGRPVHLSSVELRMLPRPGFVLTDLVVEEDPAYGSEPVLYANTVTASIRFFPLWRGRLEISRVSVDEASFNLVRASAGRWNLDSFLRNTASRPGATGGRSVPLPYIVATNARINIKDGAEKLPFSLLGADLTFWQETSGEWRLRLRGQPARTDVSLDLPDTGVVRLEASLRNGPTLSQMPVHLDLDWREAQLGQLSRLVIGSDPGWRGDLTGELHLNGTAQSADVRTRLRASGVHRAEFTPASPMDFDATCAFVYHYSKQTVQNLACDSPVGDGRARLTGDLPRSGSAPHLTLELDRIPVQVGLDALRTVRSGLDPALEARGSVSGKMSYDPDFERSNPPPPDLHPIRAKAQSAKARALIPEPLTGSFTMDGMELNGKGLTKPIQVVKAVLAPAPYQPGLPATLEATIPIPAGGSAPLAVTAHLGLSGYVVGVRGIASIARLKELAAVSGISDVSSLNELTGEPVTLDLSANGPWLQSATVIVSPSAPSASSTASAPPPPTPDRFSGTISFNKASWKSTFLANPVEISSATLHLENDGVRWDPVAFSYGLVKGSGTLEIPATCEVPQGCPPQFTVQFESLDASALQAAMLGAHEPGTLLSTLIQRLRPASAPMWPTLEGTVHLDSFILEPVTLHHVSAEVRILPTGAEISSLDGDLLGGQLHASGSIAVGDKPTYKLDGEFDKLEASAVGKLFSMRWLGSDLNGNGHLELSGFTDKDLTDSAKGTLHFEWKHGAISSGSETAVSAALARFDRWTGDATIANGTMDLAQTEVVRAGKKVPTKATVTFGNPPHLAFAATKIAKGSKR